MPLYRIADLVLDSAIALPGIAPLQARGRPARPWRFTVSRRTSVPHRASWYHHAEAPLGRRRWRSLARDGERHVIRFARCATFLLSFAERRIGCRPSASTSLETVRQLFVGQILPLVFAESGSLALHASAVRLPQGVIAFAGRTRLGKSTIACALGARGYPLIADDCAIVDPVDGTCRVRPLHVGLRLWPDALRLVTGAGREESDGDKMRVSARDLGLPLERGSAVLHRVYLLERAPAGGDATVGAVSRADAAVELMLASFQLGMDRRAQLRRTFELVTAVSGHVPVRRLRCPSGLRHLPRVVDAVLRDAAG